MDDYYNIHKNFQVQSTNIFGLGAKEYRQMATTPTPEYDSLPHPFPKIGW